MITVPPEATDFPAVFSFTAFYNEDMPNEAGPPRLPPGTLSPGKYLVLGSRVFTMSAVDLNGHLLPFFLNPIIIDTRITDRDVAFAQDIALNITLGRFDPRKRRECRQTHCYFVRSERRRRREHDACARDGRQAQD